MAESKKKSRLKKGSSDATRGGLFPISDEELERRRRLAERVKALRDKQPPLGMTTAELVHLARTEQEWLYEEVVDQGAEEKEPKC